MRKLFAGVFTLLCVWGSTADAQLCANEALLTEYHTCVRGLITAIQEHDDCGGYLNSILRRRGFATRVPRLSFHERFFQPITPPFCQEGFNASAHVNACNQTLGQYQALLNACDDTVKLLAPELFAEAPKEESECEDVRNVSNGLWKPKAESNRGAVVLLPADYDGLGGHIDGVETIRTVTGPNGGRAHFFYSLTGKQMEERFGSVEIKFDDGRCVFIENPEKRQS